MKKILFVFVVFTLIFSLISCTEARLTYSSSAKTDKVDEKPLKLSDSLRCENCSITLFFDEDSSVGYSITPSGFDMEKLEKEGYLMKITVTYDVYYKKEWDIDLGYAGSPKYEISILNSYGYGKRDENLPTSKTTETRTFSLTARIVDIKDTRLTLRFSTDNIQNRIYFKNIKVTYRCYK